MDKHEREANLNKMYESDEDSSEANIVFYLSSEESDEEFVMPTTLLKMRKRNM